MVKELSSKIFLAFHILCLSAAISLTIYWIHVFTLNNDLVTVDYKKYFSEQNNVFPVLSICLKNPISKAKLESQNPSIDVESYLKFLNGQLFDKNMTQIEYQKVIQNANDYVEEDFIRYRNGSFVAFHPEYRDHDMYKAGFVNKSRTQKPYATYAFFFISCFYQCYELPVPQDRNIYSFIFRINNNIFPTGVRAQSYDLLTIFHYPNQLLVANNRKYVWPQERNLNDSYFMRFRIQNVEVLKRRQTRSRPCNDNWENHDNDIMKKFTRDINCRPPYLDVRNVSICTSKKKLEKEFYLRSDDYGINPPCREMKKVTDLYDEATLDPKKLNWARPGFFWISIIFQDDDYKEIMQTRAIDLQALIGTVGGYIGLFLGYSMLQIPKAVLNFANKVKLLYSDRKLNIKNAQFVQDDEDLPTESADYKLNNQSLRYGGKTKISVKNGSL